MSLYESCKLEVGCYEQRIYNHQTGFPVRWYSLFAWRVCDLWAAERSYLRVYRLDESRAAGSHIARLCVMAEGVVRLRPGYVLNHAGILAYGDNMEIPYNSWEEAARALEQLDAHTAELLGVSPVEIFTHRLAV